MKLLKNVISVISTAAVVSSMLISVNAEVTDENLTAVNSATSDTIASAVSEYAVGAGKDSLYSVLPECDRTEINARILAGIPFTDISALNNAYDEAVSKTVKTDTDIYKEYLYENFSSGSFDTNGWTVTNKPFITTDNTSLSGTRAHAMLVDEGDTYCMYTAGGSINGAAYRGYISKTLEKSINGVVTIYFYDTNDGTSSNNKTYLVQVGDSNDSNHCYLGVQGNSSKYVYRTKTNDTDAALKASSITRSVGWHKIEFDATSGNNVKGYIDGQLIVTFTDMTSIGKLQIGNWRADANDWSYFSTDCVSISVPKSGDEMIAEFNYGELSEEKLEQILPYINANSDLFSSLPQCDRSAITKAVYAERPFDTIEALGESYNAALVAQTTADTKKYDIVFSEDFGAGIGSEWTTSKQPAVVSEGATFLGKSNVSLNISGDETSSAVFWGKSVSANNGVEKVSGDGITITRAVDSNSIISLYFYDYMNDKTPAIGFKINEKVLVAAYSNNSSYMFSTDGGESWQTTKVDRAKGWHKLVFDGITDSDLGITAIYLDGNEAGQTGTDIDSLSIGNFWSFDGFEIFAVDNITVAKEKESERVVVMNTSGDEITELGTNTKIRIKIENTKADKDYIIATYKNGAFYSITILTKEEQAKGTVGTQLNLNGADKVKIFGWDSIEGMNPKTAPITL